MMTNRQVSLSLTEENCFTELCADQHENIGLASVLVQIAGAQSQGSVPLWMRVGAEGPPQV
jgi:hypothetical protein